MDDALTFTAKLVGGRVSLFGLRKKYLKMQRIMGQSQSLGAALMGHVISFLQRCVSAYSVQYSAGFHMGHFWKSISCILSALAFNQVLVPGRPEFSLKTCWILCNKQVTIEPHHYMTVCEHLCNEFTIIAICSISSGMLGFANLH